MILEREIELVLQVMAFDPKRLAMLIEQKYGSKGGFAVAAKISENTVTNWVLGHTVPKIDQVVNMAKVLGTTVAFLVGETDDPKRKSDRYADIREEFKDLPESDVEKSLTDRYTASLNEDIVSDMSTEEIQKMLEDTERLLRIELLERKRDLLIKRLGKT